MKRTATALIGVLLLVFCAAAVEAHPHNADGVTSKLGNELGSALTGGDGKAGSIMDGVGSNFGLGGSDKLSGLGDSLSGMTGGLGGGGGLGGLSDMGGGLSDSISSVTSGVSGIQGDITGGLDKISKMSKLGEISSLQKGVEGLKGLNSSLQQVQSFSNNFTNKLGSWGLDSAGFKAFESQMNSFGKIMNKAQEGMDLSGTEKAIVGFLNMGNAPFKKFKNVRASYKEMAKTYDKLKKSTEAFSNIEFRGDVMEEAMKAAMPNSIKNTVARAKALRSEIGEMEERLEDLADPEQAKKELKTAAVKFFMKADEDRSCRDLSEVRNEIGQEAADLSDHIDVPGEIGEASNLLEKAHDLCEGETVFGMTLDDEEAIQRLKEEAESFGNFRKTVADAMYRQYNAREGLSSTATTKQKMQYQRNSEVALSQKIRERFLNAEKGGFSANAMRRSMQASRRGIRQNMQGMVYAQMMRMQQSGLELLLLNTRLRQISREATNQVQ